MFKKWIDDGFFVGLILGIAAGCLFISLVLGIFVYTHESSIDIECGTDNHIGLFVYGESSFRMSDIEYSEYCK